MPRYQEHGILTKPVGRAAPGEGHKGVRDDLEDQGDGTDHGVGVRDEDGAVLILALVFLVAVGLVVTALVAWAGNDLRNTVNFNTGRNLEYAAGSATQLEIQNLRYTFVGNVPTFQCTPGGGSSVVIDGQSITVYCSVQWNLPSPATRVVTLDACSSSEAMATCVGTPYLEAVVVFDDYPVGGVNDYCTSLTNETTCGRGMNVITWVVA